MPPVPWQAPYHGRCVRTSCWGWPIPLVGVAGPLLARVQDHELPEAAASQRCVLRRIVPLTAAAAPGEPLQFCTDELSRAAPQRRPRIDADPRALTSRNRIAEW